MKRWLTLLATLALASSALAAKTPYTYTYVGSGSDIATPMQGGVALMGGAADVDEAFKWMCGRSGGGDFLILTFSGTDEYNAYVKGLCPGLNSVGTLIIPSQKAALDPAVEATIMKAEAIFIGGGDQSNYLNYWTNTGVQRALQKRIDAGAPVGGISAGLAVLTQFVYSALGSKGVTSSQALADPYNRYLTLARDFVRVPNLEGTIGDTHFSARDRMGRDLAFHCRIFNNGWVSVNSRGIAVDEATALVVDERGIGTVFGPGHVYFEEAAGPATMCQPEQPLTYRNVSVHRAAQGESFDLDRWSGRGGVDYDVSAEAGVMSSTQSDGSLY
jgi:cyanophycinase